MEEKENLQLPENAFRELKDGEEYKPLMSPDKVYCYERWIIFQF